MTEENIFTAMQNYFISLGDKTCGTTLLLVVSLLVLREWTLTVLSLVWVEVLICVLSLKQTFTNSLIAFCNIVPISERRRCGSFLSSDSSFLCNCRKTSNAMTLCLTTHTKNCAEYFQDNQHGRPARFH